MRAALAAVLLLLGCRRSAEAVADAMVTTSPSAPVGAVGAPSGDPFAPPTREVPRAEPPRDNVAFDAGTLYELPAVAAAPPADPFAAAAAAVRTSAVGCFGPLPPGEYTAAIAVTVTPSGTATRIDVLSGPDDAAIRDCLRAAATRAYPSSADGRKLTIDVRVTG